VGEALIADVDHIVLGSGCRSGSLRHPAFEIAFAGARALDVETFAPATTAALN
jgi:hypothetical protein